MYILYFKSDDTQQVILLGVFSTRAKAQSIIDSCRSSATVSGPKSITKTDNYFITYQGVDVPGSVILYKGEK